MTATLATQTLAVPLRPLAETAALFRQECSALDHLVEELYRDVERLREELVRKGDEIDDGRRKLAERGRQLADQRKESSRLVTLLEQQEARVAEALTEIKMLREQTAQQRVESQEREATRQALLDQRLRAVETERDQLRHDLAAAQAATAGTGGGGESFAPLVAELSELRRQLSETQTQLAESRTQLADAIERAAQAAVHAPPSGSDPGPSDDAARERAAALERERIELESELELVRTRATELQEVVNQQRRELVEQRADVTTELRLLRELVEQRAARPVAEYEPDEEPALVGAGRGSDVLDAAPDPVVSSVMAQFARLQKDVAQRRKKK